MALLSGPSGSTKSGSRSMLPAAQWTVPYVPSVMEAWPPWRLQQPILTPADSSWIGVPEGAELFRNTLFCQMLDVVVELLLTKYIAPAVVVAVLSTTVQL